jgi:hypothetical protein
MSNPDDRPALRAAYTITFRIDLPEGTDICAETAQESIGGSGAEDALAMWLWTGAGPGAHIEHGRVVFDAIAPAGPPSSKTSLALSAEEGWRSALCMAVQYGARATEKAARAALRALGVEP